MLLGSDLSASVRKYEKTCAAGKGYIVVNVCPIAGPVRQCNPDVECVTDSKACYNLCTHVPH